MCNCKTSSSTKQAGTNWRNQRTIRSCTLHVYVPNVFLKRKTLANNFAASLSPRIQSSMEEQVCK